MAKRFTDSEKWSRPWFRKLKPEMKLFWLYLIDSCDNAGIFSIDMEAASFFIGKNITEGDVLKAMGDKLVLIKDHPDKWFVPSFIAYQYGDDLNPSVKAHQSVIKTLRRYGIGLSNSYQTVTEQLPNCTGQGQEQGLEQGQEQSEGESEGKQTPWCNDLYSVQWDELWQQWVTYKAKEHKFRFKSADSLHQGQKLFYNLARGDTATAQEILTYSIGNGYKGLQLPKHSNNDKSAADKRQADWQKFVTG